MSLKEIAQRTGVSVSTVSRVLNNKPGSCVSAGVRRQVWAAAQELGYRPNLNARNLKIGTVEPVSPTVSVIVAREDTFFSECLNSIACELLSNRFQLGDTVCIEGNPSPVLPESDGYVILGKCPEELLRACQRRTEHLVGIWRNPGALPVDEVVCSGQKAAQLAMEHLLDLGHRRIAYIGDCSYENRYVGYTEALTNHQLPLIYQLICNTPQTRADGERAMTGLLHQGEATAVLCANDEVALGALQALKQHRRRGIPISVISIDDIPDAQRARLTTVHIPWQDMAHMAVCLLADHFSGGHTEYVHVELPCRLIERDTCYYASKT